jgi:hypothetical protein
MKSKDPSGLIGKPKLRQALTALKQGLKDDADPLYDSWKHQKPAAGPLVSGVVVHGTVARADSDTGPVATAESADTRGAPADAPPKSNVPDAAPPSGQSLRPSTSDTVPVWVIRYRVFPRWARITVAATILFACSAFVLRWLVPSRSPRRAAAPGPAVEVIESAQVDQEPASGQPRAEEPAAAPPATTPSAIPAVSAASPAVEGGRGSKAPPPHAPGFLREPGF